jgi:AbrB family looped-hinge helix DNA binding protein
MVTLIRQNYQITLPASIRRQLGLKIGDVIEALVKENQIILTPKKTIDADQAYFWTKEWQEGEHQASEDIRKGRVKKFKTMKSLIEELDQ